MNPWRAALTSAAASGRGRAWHRAVRSPARRAALSLHLAESGGGELYRRVERQRRKLLALRLGDRLGLLLGELAEPAHQIVGIAAPSGNRNHLPCPYRSDSL